MSANTDEIVKLCAELSRAENLKITLKEESTVAAYITTGGAIGGLIGGPLGLAIGGMVGTMVSACLVDGPSRNHAVADIILHDMTPTQQARLAECVQRIVADLRIEDFTLLLPIVMADADKKELVVKQVIAFMQYEMSLSITRKS